MKHLHLVLLCLLFPAGIYAATTISGHITANTTWTKAGNPYTIADETFVDSNVTLTIQPGVVIKCIKDVCLYSYGKISAIGTVAEPIQFGAADADKWFGVNLKDETKGSGGSVFRHCIFRNAINVVYVGNSSVILDNCEAYDCRYGMSCANNTRRSNRISNNLMVNVGFPVNSNSICGDSIYNNRFYHGDLAISTRSGIAYYAVPVAKFVYVVNNIIGYFTRGILGTQDSAFSRIVRDNIVYKCSEYGIFFSNTNSDLTPAVNTLDISHNSILYCRVGLFIGYPEGSITHNTIMGNDSGVVTSSLTNRMVFKNNCIYNNKINLRYNCYQDAPNAFADNWWGSANADSIAAHIRDYYDYPTGLAGKAGFIPFLQAVDANCANADSAGFPLAISNINAQQPLQLKLYPNPATTATTIELPAGAQLTICNMLGVVLYTDEHAAAKQTINIASWPAGIYLVKCQNGNNTLAMRLVKE